MPFLQGSSNSLNVKIDIDNATTIRFGNGQFTEDQRNLICDLIANHANLPDINHNLNRHILIQTIMNLPRAEAVFETKKKSGPCFEGTRVALLREMANWATSPDESGMYVLSGLAGIGKSTVAYTIASRAANLNLLGAYFSFSRDESDRKNAKKFFTTIAYQLCVYNEKFAKAIGDVLQPYRGSAAITGGPREQLQTLIVDPLKGIYVQSRARPILIVVDALDECDEQDVLSVLAGLRQLVRALPSFKVVLTTRPQPRLDPFLVSRDGRKIFRVHDIEDKVVDGDIRLYLNDSLSLEKVQEHFPTCQWFASDKQVDALVRAAGRFFMIASTVIRIILDKVASNPATQMQRLLRTFAQDHMPFKDLNEFYTVILRNVVPAACDVNIVNHYQSIFGAIIFVQHPLPITALAHLIDIDVEEIRAVLVNLRSVILLDDDDIPRIYHKSFPDYITNQTLCKDPRLQIDTRIHHTEIVTRCFEIMDKHLKRNILDLSEPARFMSNEDGIKVDGITDEQIQEKIPQQLHYACAYWANHLKVANMEDEGLMNGLERFAHKHMLYWLEILSLTGQMDLAYCAIGVVVRLLMPTSSDLHQLLSDALRFISKFYKIIKRSALHTYYSALPFTPTNTLLYHQYIKEAEHNICSVEGMPEKWDALVADLRHRDVKVIKFSLDSTLLVSCACPLDKHKQGELMIWDVATGTLISTIPGDTFTVANDFSIIASSMDNTATLYNKNGSPSGTMFTTSSKVCKLALSSENSRIAAALYDGTVWLWDSGSAGLIDRFDGFGARSKPHLKLEFSCTGTRLAYSSPNGIKLRDGIDGGFVADMQCGSSSKFEFSGDGSRIASLIFDHDASIKILCMWNSESGELIAAFSDVNWTSIAVSANGSLLATAKQVWFKPHEATVGVWKENGDSLDQIIDLEVRFYQSMAFSLDNILAIATFLGIKLYNVNTCSLIHTLPLTGTYLPLAFSPDCTHLAVGSSGDVNLWDLQNIDASPQPSKQDATAVTALTLSRDCSRLACGFKDGTIKLWGTSPTNFTNQRFGTLALRSEMEKFYIRIFCQSHYMRQSVLALAFDPDGSLLASGWDNGTIELWDDGGDGVLCGTLKVPNGFNLEAVALSNTVLVATWGRCDRDQDDDFTYNGGVTLWSLGTLNPIHTFKISDDTPSQVSIADNGSLIAVCLHRNHVTLCDTVNRTTIGTFKIPFYIHTMTFLPNNSQLVVQSYNGVFQSLNLINNHTAEGPTLDHLVQLPNIPLRRPGVPIWHCSTDKNQHYFAALFSQHKSPVPVLWIPEQFSRVKAWTQGSSMIALSYEDGRVILLRLPISHVI